MRVSQPVVGVLVFMAVLGVLAVVSRKQINALFNDFQKDMSTMALNLKRLQVAQTAAQTAAQIVPKMDVRKEAGKDKENGGGRGGNPSPYGLLTTKSNNTWKVMACQRRKYREVTWTNKLGNVRVYAYDDPDDDTSFTRNVINTNKFFEMEEMGRFLKVTDPLPVLDIGCNLGQVAIQAANMGRQVLAVEPMPENYQRICRSAIDQGVAHLISIVANVVSSEEKDVVIGTPPHKEKARSWYKVAESKEDEGKRFHSITTHAIKMNTLLEVVNFKEAVIKLDIEEHEGHALVGAEELLRHVDVKAIWMEWRHVRGRKDNYGGQTIVDLMNRHNYEPYSIHFMRKLDDDWKHYPFSVIWVKRGWQFNTVVQDNA